MTEPRPLLAMDPDRARAVAAVLGTRSDRLAELTRRLDAAVRRAAWHGPDRERFLQEWTTRVAPGVERVSELLAAHATTLRVEADQQDAASR